MKLRNAPFGTLAVAAVAAALYVALVANAVAPAESGEARISQGFGGLYLTLWLWIALAILLAAGGLFGQMPRWFAVALIFLHPVAGICEFAALDAVSRDVGAAMLLVMLLPLTIAAYAVWARFRFLHEAYPPRPTSIAALSAILGLSILAALLAM